MRWPAARPGRSLEAGGNAGPRGMSATAGKATTRRDRTRLTGRLWPFSFCFSVLVVAVQTPVPVSCPIVARHLALRPVAAQMISRMSRSGPRLQEPQPGIHCAEQGIGGRRSLPEPAIEHRGVQAAEVDRVLHVPVAIEVREGRVVAVGSAADRPPDAEGEPGGTVIGPSLVFRYPPSELAPGEDHHPLLRIAIRGLDVREIVVEGAD